MMAVGVGIHHQLQHQVAHGKTTPQGALRGLVQAGLIEQHGASWWTYYRLKIPRELPEQKVPQADEDKILAYVREHGTINNTECRELLSVDLQRASYLLKRMTAEETLKREGERRWARYRLP
jgi:predicted HTH transcriptional regulator